MINLPLELSRIPIITKLVCFASLAASLVYWLLIWPQLFRKRLTDAQLSEIPVVYLLTLVPRRSYYIPWTFITAAFINTNIFTLGISLSTLLLGGRYLERAWSSRELAKFYAIIVVIPHIITFLLAYLIFLIEGDDDWLSMSIHGSIAMQAGILVAFKQLVPEHTITLLDAVKIRVRHFPALFLLSVIVTAPVLSNYQQIPLAVVGFFSSWTYLRFYKSPVPDLGSQSVQYRGDASETFAMSHFFPDFMHKPINLLSSIVYNVLSSTGVFNNSTIPSESQRPSGTGPIESDRRRALALRALDQKLNRESPEVTQPGSTSMPPQVNH